MYKFQEELYQKLTYKRDKIMLPFSFLLAKLGITPNIITTLGIASMFGFVYFFPFQPKLAVNFIFLAILCDLLDGSLARYKKTSSDKGKFIDMIADVLNFFVFLCGLSLVDLIPSTILICLAFFMLFSKVLRVFSNSQNYESDWLFRAVAGFTPNLVVGLSYLYILANAYSGFDKYIVEFFTALAIILIIDAGVSFYQIIKTNEI